jgi:hypothetical protein
MPKKSEDFVFVAIDGRFMAIVVCPAKTRLLSHVQLGTNTTYVLYRSFTQKAEKRCGQLRTVTVTVTRSRAALNKITAGQIFYLAPALVSDSYYFRSSFYFRISYCTYHSCLYLSGPYFVSIWPAVILFSAARLRATARSWPQRCSARSICT